MATADIEASSRGSAAAPDPDRFDPAYYLRANDDVRARGLDPTDHYLRFGRAEGRPANALQALRLARMGRGRPAGPGSASAKPFAAEAPPLSSPSSPNQPHGSGPARAAVGPEAAAPAAEERGPFEVDPPGWFDDGWYRAQNPDLGTGGLAPFRHYLAHGFAQGRAPNRLAAELRACISPHNHAAPDMAMAAIAASGLFDAHWYCEQYGVAPDQALLHYVSAGALLGHDPSPFFSSAAYFRANPDIFRAGANPLAHYLAFGFRENRPGVTSLADTRLTARVWLKGL